MCSRKWSWNEAKSILYETACFSNGLSQTHLQLCKNKMFSIIRFFLYTTQYIAAVKYKKGPFWSCPPLHPTSHSHSQKEKSRVKDAYTTCDLFTGGHYNLSLQIAVNMNSPWLCDSVLSRHPRWLWREVGWRSPNSCWLAGTLRLCQSRYGGHFITGMGPTSASPDRYVFQVPT